jgi:hypothetical protein
MRLRAFGSAAVSPAVAACRALPYAQAKASWILYSIFSVASEATARRTGSCTNYATSGLPVSTAPLSTGFSVAT